MTHKNICAREMSAGKNIIFGNNNTNSGDTYLNIIISNPLNPPDLTELCKSISDIIKEMNTKSHASKVLRKRSKPVILSVFKKDSIDSKYSSDNELIIEFNRIFDKANKKHNIQHAYKEAKEEYFLILKYIKENFGNSKEFEDCLNSLYIELERLSQRLHIQGDRCCKSTSSMAKAESLYRDVLDIRLCLFNEKPNLYRRGIGLVLLDLGGVIFELSGHKCRHEVEGLYRKALEVFEGNNGQEDFKTEIADALCSLAHILSLDNENLHESLVLYAKALEILRILAVKESNLNLSTLADILFEYAVLLEEKIYDYDHSLKIYQELLFVYRKLSKKRYFLYGPKVAVTLLKIAYLKILLDKGPLAFIENDLEECFNIFLKIDKVEYQEYALDALILLGDCINCQLNRRKNAAEIYNQAIDFLKSFKDFKKECFQHKLSCILLKLGSISSSENELDSADHLYKESLRILIAINNYEDYQEDLALIFYKTGEVLEKVSTDKKIETIDAYSKSLQIYQQLVKKDYLKYKNMEAKLVFKIGLLTGLEKSALLEAENMYLDLLGKYKNLSNQNDNKIQYKSQIVTFLHEMKEILATNTNRFQDLLILCQEELDLLEELSKLKLLYKSIFALRLQEYADLKYKHEGKNAFSSCKHSFLKSLKIYDDLISYSAIDEYYLGKSLTLSKLYLFLLEDQKEVDGFKHYYQEDLSVFSILAKNNPDQYSASLTLKVIYFISLLTSIIKNNNSNYIDELIIEVDEVFSKEIARLDDLRLNKNNNYESSKGLILYHKGIFLYNIKDYSKSLYFLKQSHEIYKSLEKEFPGNYLNELSDVLHFLANIIPDGNHLRPIYYQDLKKCYKKLADNQPELYNLAYANILIESAYNIPTSANCLSDYQKAIKIIKSLIESDSLKYESELAQAYYYYAITSYNQFNNKGEAVLYLKRSTNIYEKLSKVHPDLYLSKLQEVSELRKKILRSNY